jgi:hypothetical protein
MVAGPESNASRRVDRWQGSVGVEGSLISEGV